MKICMLSDLHGHLPLIEKSDLLLIAGDICPHFKSRFVGDIDDLWGQREWLDTTFRNWLEKIPVKRIVGVAGNHCFVFQKKMQPNDLPWIYLEDSYCEIEGIKIWGTPYSLWFHDWAFNAPEVGGEEYLTNKFKDITADIIISHGPPFGYGDLTITGRRTGSRALVDLIDRIKPQLVVCGHIHSENGIYECGKTKIVNAAILDDNYKYTNKVYYINFL